MAAASGQGKVLEVRLAVKGHITSVSSNAQAGTVRCELRWSECCLVGEKLSLTQEPFMLFSQVVRLALLRRLRSNVSAVYLRYTLQAKVAQGWLLDGVALHSVEMFQRREIASNHYVCTRSIRRAVSTKLWN
jgi:hypothetical protein